MKELDPLKSCSVRNHKPDLINSLLRGNFDTDGEASDALDWQRRLGELYFNGMMPKWLRRRINAGLCTPLVKKAAP